MELIRLDDDDDDDEYWPGGLWDLSSPTRD